jgi:hypothetical protein
MGIGTSSSSGKGRTRPTRIAYAVNLDPRLSWGGLPATGRRLSSVRPGARHLARCAALHRLDDRWLHGHVNVAIIERQLWELYEEVMAEEAS